MVEPRIQHLTSTNLSLFLIIAFGCFTKIDSFTNIHNDRINSLHKHLNKRSIQEINSGGTAYRHLTKPKPLYSTPFDVSLYDDDENNPFITSMNKLACPPNTKLVLGINKYSHDTTLCAANYDTGEVLFALSKERLSRKKHQGGNVATLVETCLDQLELDLDNIEKVVFNNHHHRVLHMEQNIQHMEWEVGMNINEGCENGYTDEENLLMDVESKLEISHHLAHAYSAAVQSPFEEGLVVVMDGIGETYRTMKEAIEKGDKNYVSDLQFEGDFECIPNDIQEKSGKSIFDWREAESAYEFTKSSHSISVKPIFKRFVEERSPPVLYNHGFENMESAGALYSRASSHIFGDWNACGKVMGLAPWMGHKWMIPCNDDNDGVEEIAAEPLKHPIMTGQIYKEGDDGMQFDRSAMMGAPYFNRNDPDLFDEEGNMIRKRRYDFDDNETVNTKNNNLIGEGGGNNAGQLPTNVALEAISLAHRVQIDLESVLMDFVKYCKDKSGQENLCLAGGVALNSVLNGRLSRELGFKKVFIPSCPGDDGIAVGCCAYGLFGNDAVSKDSEKESSETKPKLWSEPLSPYLGPEYTTDDIDAAIEAAMPWIEVEKVNKNTARYDIMCKEIESGGVIAWYQGRSELGPRALGHRSILADPRKKGLVRFINESVKKRESFRPFAPSCLAEHSSNWFNLGDDLEDNSNISPYMSMTAIVKDSKRDIIPAVTHVDGSSRLQTVTKESEPSYHELIHTFFKRTGVPMLLNTSFNTLPSEPIVESPREAIRSFLSSMGALEMLVMDDYIIKRKDADVRRLLGERDIKGVVNVPSYPKRTGPAYYESKFVIGNSNPDEQNGVETKTRVSMPNRIIHDERNGGWFNLIDELEAEILGICDGTVSVNEIINQYLDASEESAAGENEQNTEFQEILVNNVLKRIIRLYEHTLICW